MSLDLWVWSYLVSLSRCHKSWVLTRCLRRSSWYLYCHSYTADQLQRGHFIFMFTNCSERLVLKWIWSLGKVWHGTVRTDFGSIIGTFFQSIFKRLETGVCLINLFVNWAQILPGECAKNESLTLFWRLQHHLKTFALQFSCTLNKSKAKSLHLIGCLGRTVRDIIRSFYFSTEGSGYDVAAESREYLQERYFAGTFLHKQKKKKIRITLVIYRVEEFQVWRGLLDLSQCCRLCAELKVKLKIEDQILWDLLFGDFKFFSVS